MTPRGRYSAGDAAALKQLGGTAPQVARPVTSRPARLPLQLTVDGEQVTVPDTDPADLWAGFERGDWPAIVPGLLDPADRVWLWDRVADPADRFDLPDLARVARGVMGMLAGCPWWVACTVAASCARERFLFGAYVLRRGMDVYELPVWQVCALGYMFVMDGATDPADTERRLWSPPVRAGAAAAFTREQETANFRQAMAALGRGKSGT